MAAIGSTPAPIVGSSETPDPAAWATQHEPVYNVNVLTLIFQWLDPLNVFQAQYVCRDWYFVASLDEVLRYSFNRTWKLAGVKGNPRHPSLWATAKAGSFAVKHRVQYTDTLMKLAVQHGVDVHALKRMNNLMNDHSLHSRHCLFIPAASAEQIAGQYARFEHCPVACRDILVLSKEPVSEEADKEAQQKDKVNTKLTRMLGRCLRVDQETARFYLEDAQFDVKAALVQFEIDEKFERQQQAGAEMPVRKALVQRWIDGQYGF